MYRLCRMGATWQVAIFYGPEANEMSWESLQTDAEGKEISETDIAGLSSIANLAKL